MKYRFKDHRWLGNKDGTRVPIEVYYETILLGEIESQPRGAYIITVIKSPTKDIPLSPAQPHNYFNTKEEAAQTLHRMWVTLRKSKENI